MIIDTSKLVIGIDMLRESLEKSVLVVTFTKQDGSERVMKCTKNISLIPADKLPKPKAVKDAGLPLAERELTLEAMPPVRDPQLFVVWDLDKAAWRSFIYTTIKTVALL